jgi:uncharacterized protein HemY
LWQDPAAIAGFAAKLEEDPEALAVLSPQMLYLVATVLPEEHRERWLTRAQSLHLSDFWLNFSLGQVLCRHADKAATALGFLRVALALRPSTAAVYIHLGHAYRSQGDLAAAIDAHKKGLGLDPSSASTRTRRGWGSIPAVRRRCPS